MGADADDIVTLRRGAMECTLCPRRGGSIARLAWHGADGTVELVRPASAGALRGGSAIDMGCFPLIPYSNRIAAGRFRFDGRAVRLPPDPMGGPHAIHGHGWTADWTVEERAGPSVRLAFRHAADAWPWAYSATQTITLDEDGLTVAIALTNEGDGPMPAGIGLHPYLPKPPGTVLTARVGGVWLNDGSLLPGERTPLPAAWAFPRGVAMDRTVLDNGFTGWDGRATLLWPASGGAPARRLSIQADGPFGHLVIYAPRGEDYLCVEPVSHMTDAVNRAAEPDSGLCALTPGKRLSGTVRFRLEPA